VLLCIASKNNTEDIDSIFDSNLMTGLSKDDFAAIAGGWANKSASIAKILSDLNFDERYVAFIDDNKRELYEVGTSFPNMICVDGSDPSSVLSTLSTILSFEDGANPELAAKRVTDIQTSQIRSRMREKSTDSDALLMELKTRIKSNLANKFDDLARAADLFRKTNQFNLTLNRTTVEDLNLLQSPTGVVIASLTDSISDSGPIASMYFSQNITSLEIIEFAISCRALGRDTEKYIFRSLLNAANVDFMNYHVFVRFRVGPKNQPASQFINRYFISESDSQTLNANKLISETSKWYGAFCES
jgi:FkbH-like protein